MFPFVYISSNTSILVHPYIKIMRSILSNLYVPPSFIFHSVYSFHSLSGTTSTIHLSSSSNHIIFSAIIYILSNLSNLQFECLEHHMKRILSSLSYQSFPIGNFSVWCIQSNLFFLLSPITDINSAVLLSHTSHQIYFIDSTVVFPFKLILYLVM